MILSNLRSIFFFVATLIITAYTHVAQPLVTRDSACFKHNKALLDDSSQFAGILTRPTKQICTELVKSVHGVSGVSVGLDYEWDNPGLNVFCGIIFVGSVFLGCRTGAPVLVVDPTRPTPLDLSSPMFYKRDPSTPPYGRMGPDTVGELKQIIEGTQGVLDVPNLAADKSVWSWGMARAYKMNYIDPSIPNEAICAVSGLILGIFVFQLRRVLTLPYVTASGSESTRWDEWFVNPICGIFRYFLNTPVEGRIHPENNLASTLAPTKRLPEEFLQSSEPNVGFLSAENYEVIQMLLDYISIYLKIVFIWLVVDIVLLFFVLYFYFKFTGERCFKTAHRNNFFSSGLS
jgi:hypothetical protein